MNIEELRQLAGREVTLTVQIQGALSAPVLDVGCPPQVSLVTSATKRWFRAEDIISAEPVVQVPESWPPIRGDVWQNVTWKSLYLAGEASPGNWCLYPNSRTANPLERTMFDSEHPAGKAQSYNRAMDFRLVTPGQARYDKEHNE